MKLNNKYLIVYQDYDGKWRADTERDGTLAVYSSIDLVLEDVRSLRCERGVDAYALLFIG